MINNYGDFVNELITAGFSVASGGNDEGVFGLLEYGWDKEPPDSTIRWHTGDPETDPWEWRMRVLEERDDISYAKVFFRKAGYITREWYPCFLAARRGGKDFEDDYSDGKISHFAKRIFDAVAEHGSLPLHEIKRYAGFARDDKTKFDGALAELQMKMYLTMCGRRQKTSHKGEDNSWASTVFCTTEKFWGEDVFREAAKISAEEAADKIRAQVFMLNPFANKKKTERFIRG